MPYRHLFFDLDHTLWDFETNSRTTLEHLYKAFGLAELGLFSAEAFIRKYQYINQRLWHLYNLGKVTPDELRTLRFEQTFVKLGAKRKQIPAGLPEAYMDLCPTQPHVLPFTHELMQYLQPRYHMHIITNGFPDSQAVKLHHAGLAPYFREVITSICAGCPKPNVGIFRFALEKAGAQTEESLMIGDNFEADVLGAKAAGLDQVFYNPQKRRHRQQPTYEVNCLSELMGIL